jgi:hypothetical protein
METNNNFICYLFPKISNIKNSILTSVLLINSSIAISLLPVFCQSLYVKVTGGEIDPMKFIAGSGAMMVILFPIIFIYGAIGLMKLFYYKSGLVKSPQAINGIRRLLFIGSVCMLIYALVYTLFYNSDSRMLFETLTIFFQNFYFKVLVTIVITSVEYLGILWFLRRGGWLNGLGADFIQMNTYELASEDIKKKNELSFFFSLKIIIYLFIICFCIGLNLIIYDFIRSRYQMDIFQLRAVKYLLGVSIIFIHISYLIEFIGDHANKKRIDFSDPQEIYAGRDGKNS